MPTRFIDFDGGSESAIIAVVIGLKPGDDSLTDTSKNPHFGLMTH